MPDPLGADGPRLEGLRFLLVSAPGERETDRLLEAACAARSLPFTRVVPGGAAGLDLGGRETRRLIYRTGVSLACLTLESLLCRDGDAALHDPFFRYANQPLILRRAGLPRPRTVYVPDLDPHALDRQVEAIGGFPVVMKVPGTEGGQGVSLSADIDSLVASIATASASPTLEEFFPHPRCWRVTVLGGRMLAATARTAGAGDFRTNGPGSRPIEGVSPPAGLAEIAIAAARVLRLEFGGADIMESEDGTLRICEFNFPCYFADQQEQTGVDIAGEIVDHLIAMPGSAY